MWHIVISAPFQVSGYTIVAERLNFLRYLSHFRSIHRGQFFTTMKSTAVRKLLPESWGFVCPVHTPDGGTVTPTHTFTNMYKRIWLRALAFTNACLTHPKNVQCIFLNALAHMRAHI